MRGYFRLLQGATSSAPISIIHTPVPPSPWGLSAGSLVVVMQSWAPDSCPMCRRAAPALAAHPDRQVETIHPNRRGCEGITQPQEGAHGSQRQHKALSCTRCPHAAPPSRAAPGEGEELKAQGSEMGTVREFGEARQGSTAPQETWTQGGSWGYGDILGQRGCPGPRVGAQKSWDGRTLGTAALERRALPGRWEPGDIPTSLHQPGPAALARRLHQ